MSWILTYSGRHYDFLDPRPEDIHVIDIAHGLANAGRFAGHTRSFYPIAQHSVMGSHIVPKAFAFEFLMHDAHEAYVTDIPAPLKMLLPDYQAVEDRSAGTLRARYGLPLTMSPEVKHADLVMLATERRDLMPADPMLWPILEGIEPLPRRLYTWSPAKAKAAFLQRYLELAGDLRRAA
jgi:hypothetical protein